MSQRISNIYRLVTLPSFYKKLMALLGAETAKARLAKELFCPDPGAKVLDVGCGPASILPFLPKVDYTGIDLNPKHIAYATAAHGSTARFLVGDAATAFSQTESFDLVIVSALLHHLDDRAARTLLEGLCRVTSQGARIVTFDNVWIPRQNPVAYWLNRLDSGLNVRTESGYLRLIQGLPLSVEGRVYRDLLRIPYDHFAMILTRL